MRVKLFDKLILLSLLHYNIRILFWNIWWLRCASVNSQGILKIWVKQRYELNSWRTRPMSDVDGAAIRLLQRSKPNMRKRWPIISQLQEHPLTTSSMKLIQNLIKNENISIMSLDDHTSRLSWTYPQVFSLRSGESDCFDMNVRAPHSVIP